MKRILALLLSILLMLSFCALGEEAVGQYAFSEPTLRLLLAQVWTREPEAVSFVEAIAKNIVDMHGGTITVESDLKGTRFIVTLKADFDVNREQFENAQV